MLLSVTSRNKQGEITFKALISSAAEKAASRFRGITRIEDVQPLHVARCIEQLDTGIVSSALGAAAEKRKRCLHTKKLGTAVAAAHHINIKRQERFRFLGTGLPRDNPVYHAAKSQGRGQTYQTPAMSEKRLSSLCLPWFGNSGMVLRLAHELH